jgi:hypothetical protein
MLVHSEAMNYLLMVCIVSVECKEVWHTAGFGVQDLKVCEDILGTKGGYVLLVRQRQARQNRRVESKRTTQRYGYGVSELSLSWQGTNKDGVGLAGANDPIA